MKKLLWRLMVIVFVLANVFGFAAWKLSQSITPLFIAEELEKSINSRVQIGSVDVSLFSSPARVVINDLQLGVRDQEVKKAYSERELLRGAPVSVEKATLAVNLLGLLKRRLEVKELSLLEPKVTMLLFEEGGNSLDILFKSPDEREEEKEEEIVKSISETSEEDEHETFHISQLKMLGALEGVRLENGSINIVVEKTGLVMTLEQLGMGLNDLVISRGKTTKMPTVKLDLSGILLIDSPANDQARYSRIGFSGLAMADLFDPDSGEFSLAAEMDLKLDEESYLGTNVPAVQKAWAALQKLKKVGVKIGPLPEKATFGESESISLYYDAERVTLRQPLSLVIDDWHLGLEKESWIQIEKETHGADATLVARQKLSDKIREKLVEGVDNLPREIRPAMIEALEEAWFRDGRLYAQIVSEGALSKPSLDVLNKTPDLERVAKDAAKEYATERLKKLFGQ